MSGPREVVIATPPVALLGLEKTNLRQQAVTALRTAITSGELAPRSPLIETELSDDDAALARQTDENPGLLVRLHPDVRSYVLPDLLS